jgi:hypothetical protein
MRADGVDGPGVRTTAEILADPENHPDVAAGESAVLIPLMLDCGRTVRANVMFDAGLLEAIDAEAARRGLTRSAFLASAAREKIGHGAERRHDRALILPSTTRCLLTKRNRNRPGSVVVSLERQVIAKGLLCPWSREK